MIVVVVVIAAAAFVVVVVVVVVDYSFAVNVVSDAFFLGFHVKNSGPTAVSRLRVKFHFRWRFSTSIKSKRNL